MVTRAVILSHYTEVHYAQCQTFVWYYLVSICWCWLSFCQVLFCWVLCCQVFWCVSFCRMSSCHVFCKMSFCRMSFSRALWRYEVSARKEIKKAIYLNRFYGFNDCFRFKKNFDGITISQIYRYTVKIRDGKPYWKGRLSTVDLLVLTSLNQLLFLFVLQTIFTFLQNKLPKWGGHLYWAFPFS
jgi:hypothetical protein